MNGGGALNVHAAVQCMHIHWVVRSLHKWRRRNRLRWQEICSRPRTTNLARHVRGADEGIFIALSRTQSLIVSAVSSEDLQFTSPRRNRTELNASGFRAV